jgi:hypothetical protein
MPIKLGSLFKSDDGSEAVFQKAAALKKQMEAIHKSISSNLKRYDDLNMFRKNPPGPPAYGNGDIRRAEKKSLMTKVDMDIKKIVQLQDEHGRLMASIGQPSPYNQDLPIEKRINNLKSSIKKSVGIVPRRRRK